MGKIRKPFQGVLNIVRFNWHFYVLSAVTIVMLWFASEYLPHAFHLYPIIFSLLILLTTIISLSVSYYVYDASNLYSLNWLKDDKRKISIININAGFDETSELLQIKFTNAKLVILDFYDPQKHTEVSIKRARKAYPAFPNTTSTPTEHIGLQSEFADQIFLTLAAHEIRDDSERIVFFKELYRILKPEGQIIVTEHLRDAANFFAYNIGFFHFLSKRTWYKTFSTAGLQIKKEHKITPFISTFTLTKYGTAN